MKLTELFIGREVEGPERGLITLFIPKNATNRFSFLKIAKEKNIKRLYFGAGNDYGINYDLFPYLHEIPNDYKVLLEILSFDDLVGIPMNFLSRTQIIFVIKSEKYIKMLPSVFKIETKENVHWFTLQYPTTTFLKDKLYLEDKNI